MNKLFSKGILTLGALLNNFFRVHQRLRDGIVLVGTNHDKLVPPWLHSISSITETTQLNPAELGGMGA